MAGMTVTDIISDADLERVHGNAKFGAMSMRLIVSDGVLKYAIGYTSGHTQFRILLEHGLIRTPKPGSYRSSLTAKGRRYLRAMIGPRFQEIANMIAADQTP